MWKALWFLGQQRRNTRAPLGTIPLLAVAVASSWSVSFGCTESPPRKSADNSAGSAMSDLGGVGGVAHPAGHSGAGAGGASVAGMDADEADGGAAAGRNAMASNLGSGGSAGMSMSMPSPSQSGTPVDHEFALWRMPDALAGSQTAPSYSAAADIVTDDITGLLWQRNLPVVYEGCSGTFGLLDMSPAVPGHACTWEEAQKYCASPALAASLGGSGWRLPTKIELESIVDETRADPAIDAQAFPAGIVPKFQVFWTTTQLLSSVTTEAWQVDFFNGVSTVREVGSSSRVRCVRSSGPQTMSNPSLRYEVMSDTAKDLQTGLTWQRSQDSGQSWQAAKAYCQSLTIAGGKWRLPALKELLTLVDPKRSFPAIDPVGFPDAQQDKFWTASPVVGASVAWVVEFGRGLSDQAVPDSGLDVRCVR